MTTPIILSDRASRLVSDSLEVNSDGAENQRQYLALRALCDAVGVLGVAGTLRALADAQLGVVDMASDHGSPFDLPGHDLAALKAMADALLALAGKVGT